MIIGTGTDICDSRRIGKLITRFGDAFLDRVFTPAERAVCDARPGSRRTLCYAKRFAAKEACLKALGTGMVKGVRWRDMETTLSPSGQPVLAAPTLLAARGLVGARIHLSLSDEPPLALAFVILETDG